MSPQIWVPPWLYPPLRCPPHEMWRGGYYRVEVTIVAPPHRGRSRKGGDRIGAVKDTSPPPRQRDSVVNVKLPGGKNGKAPGNNFTRRSRHVWQHADSWLYIQSRLKVSIRVAKKYAFLLCIGGWCSPMVEVELPYLLDFLKFYPLPLSPPTMICWRGFFNYG
jgi:hypothetical protein